MGESDRREEYSQKIFVDDVKGVIDDLSWSYTCIAHSMGGSIATLATSNLSDIFEHLVPRFDDCYTSKRG